MSRLEVSRTIHRPTDKVWSVLADYPNIANWSTGLKASHSLGDTATGIGAERRCEFSGKGYIVERVTTWEEGETYMIDMVESDMPLKRAKMGFRLTPKGTDTEATFVMDYDPKMGIIGKAMDALMMRRMMTKNGEQVLADLATAAEKA